MQKTSHGIPFDMTIDELIEVLQEEKKKHGGNTHIRLMEYEPASDRYDVGVQLCLAKSKDYHWLKEINSMKSLMQDEISIGFH